MAILDMKIFCGCDFEHENFCCWSWQNFGGTLIFGHGKFLSWNEIFVFVVGMGFFLHGMRFLLACDLNM